MSRLASDAATMQQIRAAMANAAREVGRASAATEQAPKTVADLKLSCVFSAELKSITGTKKRS